MALPGQSPSFNGPSSPSRPYNGYSDHQQHPPMFGPPRTMLPPSPQHFPPSRFSQPALQANSPATAANNGPPPPYKRPGSSMSISSMLGTEPERPIQDQFQNHNQPARPQSGQHSQQGPPVTFGAVMSPPQYLGKANTSEYTYKPRSKTPDRSMGNSNGVRAHRSSSGSMMQRPGPFYEPPSRPQATQPNLNPFGEPKYTTSFASDTGRRDDLEDRGRRTSIGGILQRPESQPQAHHMSPSFRPTSHPLSRPESIPPTLAPMDRHVQQPLHRHDPPRSNGHYDTRPPPFSSLSRIPTTASQLMPTHLDRPPNHSLSPELRRAHLNGGEGRLAGILNQQGDPIFGGQSMMRQDSMQSQSDRSIIGDRLRNNRPYSPFAGSVASGPVDDPVRKGSEELSQHRTIMSLANEAKRGRYSPVPQAVQGAQAHTPAPDAGIKTEHGRVFAGIGGGMGSASAGPTPTPQPLSASPFKRDEGAARLSEENLMKMSRSTSGINKRNRKALDEDLRAESDVGDVKKGPGRGKRSKYAHSYKLDLDDPAIPPRKNGLFSASNPGRRTATPTSNPSHLATHNPLTQLNGAAGRQAPPKPKKIIKITSVVAEAARNERHHLGIYRYDPQITKPISTQPSTDQFDVSIRPNILPSFTDPAKVNCTYTVKVSRTWLRQKELILIAKEQYLWGSGIYTDDSDPVAAAMHSGFIHRARAPDPLLDRLVDSDNPKIDGLDAPDTPIAVPGDKDLRLTLVVLPPLESYAGSVRYGIKSRSWPRPTEDGANPAPHDGVSFMILSAEFFEDGVMNKRMGRTGAERRKVLQQELAERQRTIEFRDRYLVEVRKRNEETARKRRAQAKADQKMLPDQPDAVQTRADEHNSTSQTNGNLDVGLSPDAWIRQLNENAADA